MLRILHIFAIMALIASAVYAYTIKYDTLLNAEKVARLKTQILREQDMIAVYKAEWQRLNAPDRLQALAEKHLSLQPLSPLNIVRIEDIPMRTARADEIGRKLELLGVLAPTDTPHVKSADRALTPTPLRASMASSQSASIQASKIKNSLTKITAPKKNVANNIAKNVEKNTSSTTPQYTGSLRSSASQPNISRPTPPRPVTTPKTKPQQPDDEPLRLLPPKPLAPMPLEQLLR
jgi:hypothetical protein